MYKPINEKIMAELESYFINFEMAEDEQTEQRDNKPSYFQINSKTLWNFHMKWSHHNIISETGYRFGKHVTAFYISTKE